MLHQLLIKCYQTVIAQKLALWFKTWQNKAIRKEYFSSFLAPHKFWVPCNCVFLRFKGKHVENNYTDGRKFERGKKSPKVEMGYNLHFLSSDCLCDYAIFMRSLIFCLESLMYCSWSCNNKHQVSPLSWAKGSEKEGGFARKRWSSLPRSLVLSALPGRVQKGGLAWGRRVHFLMSMQVELVDSGHIWKGAWILEVMKTGAPENTSVPGRESSEPGGSDPESLLGLLW